MNFKKNIMALSTIILATNIFIACGKSPDKQSDIVKEELKKTVQEKENTLTPLTGKYQGVLKNEATGLDKKIELNLVSTIMIVQNPGRNDVTEMPTLGGNINVYFSEDLTDVMTLAQFTNSMYTSEDGHLRLNGTLNTGTSVGNVINTFDGKVAGNTITGTLTNSIRGVLGKVEVTKIGANQ